MNKTIAADGTVITELEDFPKKIIENMLTINRAMELRYAEMEKLRVDILSWDLARQKLWREVEAWLNKHEMTHLDSNGVQNVVKFNFFKMKAELHTKI